MAALAQLNGERDAWGVGRDADAGCVPPVRVEDASRDPHDASRFRHPSEAAGYGASMIIRRYSLTTRNRFGAALLAAGLIAAGGALLVLGVTVLLSLAVVGGVVGAGLALYRRISGSPPARLRDTRAGLDPADEVFPESTPRDELPPPSR